MFHGCCTGAQREEKEPVCFFGLDEGKLVLRATEMPSPPTGKCLMLHGLMLHAAIIDALTCA